MRIKVVRDGEGFIEHLAIATPKLSRCLGPRYRRGLARNTAILDQLKTVTKLLRANGIYVDSRALKSIPA